MKFEESADSAQYSFSSIERVGMVLIERKHHE